MFPTQPRNDLGFEIQTTTQENQLQDDDLVTNYDHFLENNNIRNFCIGGSSDKQPRKRTTDPGPGPSRQKQKQRKDESSSNKKAMHREVEKKRRQEMSNLHASLNSLLPPHHLKGKRSVCEQIEEAATHIKRMEKNIEELKGRRERLKSLYENTSSDYVTINMGGSHGLEILISHGIVKANNLGLSRVLAELQRNELDVVSCVSSRINEGFLHKIHVEAKNMVNLDLFLLQDRLSKAMK